MIHGVAIETSQRRATVAAFADDRVLDQREIAAVSGTARLLAPTLADLICDAGWRPRQVDLVAVSCGPGSFTGLRVGITTAKLWAYAAGADIVAVPTHVAIAQRVPSSIDAVWTIDGAQRGQVFATLLRRMLDGSGIFRPEGQTQRVSWQTWCRTLQPGYTLTGPALEQRTRDLPRDVHLVESSRWNPTAAAVAQVAWVMYRSGARDDPWSLEPQYVQRSAAEERFATRQRTPARQKE